MKILCVEDDQALATLLQRSLVKQHYQVELATDGQMGWDLIEAFSYDLILLDWMLPKLTGIELCQRLRGGRQSEPSLNRNTPILLMTALDAVTHKVLGLNAGADDYVVKPFDLDELFARIRALLRRSQGSRSPLLWRGELCLNPNSCEVTYRDRPIFLAAKEYELLELFLRNPDQIFSVDRLLSNLWNLEETPSQGAVRAHIKGLRQKLKHVGVDDPIETVYKLGYRLKPQKEKNAENQMISPSSSSSSSSSSLSPSSSSAPPSSPSSSSSMPAVASPIPPEFWDVWQECRQSYCDRLSVIQHAVTALKHGTLTATQQQDAAQEAHTLIGSLGSFGLEEASRISRQIQHILKQQPPLEQATIEQLSQLITTLRLHLEMTGEEKPAQPSPVNQPSPSNQPLSSNQPSPSNHAQKTQQIKEISPSSPSIPFLSLLIVDDDIPLAQLLAQEALSRGLQAQIATTLDDAQQVLNDGAVDAVLLDLNFADSTQSGLNFLATVHHQHPDIPVIMLTAEETFEKRVEAVRLGSRYFLQKPIAPAQVLTAVTQVLQQTSESAAHILIVDDDLAFLHLLSTILQPCGYQVTLLSDPQQFWQTLEQTAPDLLILDVELGQPPTGSSEPNSDTISSLSGIELCQVIRSDLRWNRLPVLFLSAHTDIETVQRSFAVGADDFLNKPVVAQELLTRVKTRLEQRKLWGATDLDELTGVRLRRKAQEDLTRLIRLARRQQQPFSLAVLDLDHFKRVNDQYGHAVGDQVLNYLGTLLRQSFRQEDLVGRWGGEEFIIGMYGSTKQDGMKRLEEVRLQLQQYTFLTPNGMSFQITFSAGIAQLPDDGNELQALYSCADQALYRAKSAGRNRVFAAPSSYSNSFMSDGDRQPQEPL